MSPNDKFRLVQDIYFSLQTTHNIEEITGILLAYGIEHIPTKEYTQKSVKGLLSQADDTIVLNIAKDLNLATPFIKNAGSTKTNKKVTVINKVFISHAKEDEDIVSDFILILQNMGVMPETIFCSSLEGYATSLGHNFEDDIKTRLNEDVLVLFMISDHFYNSKMCLLEMGAAWGLTKDQVSVAIPPFKLEDMKGVFQKFQGIIINDENQLELLKEKLEEKLDIKPERPLVWYPKRDMVLKSIRSKLPNN